MADTLRQLKRPRDLGESYQPLRQPQGLLTYEVRSAQFEVESASTELVAMNWDLRDAYVREDTDDFQFPEDHDDVDQLIGAYEDGVVEWAQGLALEDVRKSLEATVALGMLAWELSGTKTYRKVQYQWDAGAQTAIARAALRVASSVGPAFERSEVSSLLRKSVIEPVMTLNDFSSGVHMQAGEDALEY